MTGDSRWRAVKGPVLQPVMQATGAASIQANLLRNFILGSPQTRPRETGLAIAKFTSPGARKLS